MPSRAWIAAAGVASNAVEDVKITVIDESEVALALQTGTKEKPVPVKGRLTQDPPYEVTKYQYDAIIPADYFDVCHMGGVPYLCWTSLADKGTEIRHYRGWAGERECAILKAVIRMM